MIGLFSTAKSERCLGRVKARFSYNSGLGPEVASSESLKFTSSMVSAFSLEFLLIFFQTFTMDVNVFIRFCIFKMSFSAY